MGHRYANAFMQCCAKEQNYIKCDTLGQYKLAMWDCLNLKLKFSLLSTP